MKVALGSGRPGCPFANPLPQDFDFLASDALTDRGHGLNGGVSRLEVVDKEALVGLTGDNEGAEGSRLLGAPAVFEAHPTWKSGAVVTHGALGLEDRLHMFGEADGFISRGLKGGSGEAGLTDGPGFRVG